MGAPENLSLLKANEQSGSSSDSSLPRVITTTCWTPSGSWAELEWRRAFHERINLPGETVQITLQGLRRIVVEASLKSSPSR